MGVNYKNTDDECSHSGTKGMHWYERRYQYPDGSLTPEGKIRYRKMRDGLIKETGNAINIGRKAAINNTVQSVGNSVANKAKGEKKNKKIDGKKLAKNALITFGTVAVTSLVAKGANAAVDQAINAGKVAIKNVNWGDIAMRAQYARKGLIYI